jgi:prepilin-type N-terminal cleavage/methylation domain-containing protein
MRRPDFAGQPPGVPKSLQCWACFLQIEKQTLHIFTASAGKEAPMDTSGSKGFTLIELVIVVAIIGIIAAIAIPQYHSYREKSERSVIISDCNAIFRGFMVYFIENGEYPYAASAGPQKFDLATFAPLTDVGLMGIDIGLEVNIQSLRKNLFQNKAEAFDSPDVPLGLNQTFYLVLPWVKDPATKFVVAQSEHVKQADGTEIDGGLWMDGVFVTRNGQVIFK